MTALIKMLLTGGGMTQLVSIASLLATLSGGAVWLYSSIKEKGAAEQREAQLAADYDEMKRSAGEAILKLNQQYAAKANAAAEHQRQAAADAAESSAEIDRLRKELLEDEDECTGRPVSGERLEWLRQLSESATE